MGLGRRGHNSRALARWLIGAMLIVAAGPLARSEEPDRARLESEASGQATEADRLFKAGDFAAALPLYQAERGSRAKLGDLRYEAYAARAIGCCLERLGDLDAAIDSWEAARVLDAKRTDRGFEGYDLAMIGQAHLRRERLKEAIAALTRALPLLSQAIDRDHETDARLLLAHALLVNGDDDAIGPHLERALTLALALDDPKRRADVLAEMGRVALARDESGPAAEWLAEAHNAYESKGLVAEAAAIARLQGDALRALDLPEAARARVDAAASVHQRRNDPAALADDRVFLAELRTEESDLPGARGQYRLAAAAFRDADDPEGEIEALVALAHLEGGEGRWTAASTVLGDAVALVRRTGQPPEQVPLLLLAADVAHRAAQDNRAKALLDEAQTIARRADNGALVRMVTEARRRSR